ncbi:cilia- and flagella-associated protein 161 [Hemicordylus capensis]|uniref:cilia- and flagella-associated protein 161 n=1 Tax=Hemicordylus capensis TaxID=884348 RepID=UPI002302CC00|nr:cilia- and flagella-associated protein 161 [Hemicordylus capensis]
MFNVRTSTSGRHYSPGVLVGNWNEDVYLEEDFLKDFIYKRERGELLIQRSKKFKDHFYKTEPLSVAKDGFVHFGDTVMLVNPESNQARMENPLCVHGKLALAVNADELSAHITDKLPSPCGVTAITCTAPIARNAFRILSTEGEAMGEPIRFGQNFGLGCTGGFPDQMLFLASDHKTFMNMAKKSSLQSTFLTDELSYLCSWQAIFLDPQFRLEYEGFPVPANTKILISHSHTNNQLAVPRTFWTRTYFGKEYEVNCHTYLNSHKAEEEKNYWLIATGNASDISTSMLDRPQPPSEDTREHNREVLQTVNCP